MTVQQSRRLFYALLALQGRLKVLKGAGVKIQKDQYQALETVIREMKKEISGHSVVQVRATSEAPPSTSRERGAV